MGQFNKTNNDIRQFAEDAAIEAMKALIPKLEGAVDSLDQIPAFIADLSWKISDAMVDQLRYRFPYDDTE